ncbi:hypothetical protein PGT21_028680 [Puccinia graminis f. sp. tritici]|uniref:Uncharacterized protein n=2 Tax=Puccinia graminis f. sp. tritici TaxID=56615 RepID=H6QRZ7_PUCGT|nr:uncharacterized protein PGTG_21565 [Puccinia graminis f. sp. tritici CRL 75-36-700-3]EHS63432.1 hypothetical protein PGTG_21565 [Puccinia graminis f. sp. tritici CRL 75-36-700-3]KAA1066338.1 hypothetical protein PGT21_028680 [Puccinia graminis f. sp. tritici]KAA1128340.1 hypothetical protein PGTUg99_011266 [Puccinia graminis f. sp. tritici]
MALEGLRFLATQNPIGLGFAAFKQQLPASSVDQASPTLVMNHRTRFRRFAKPLAEVVLSGNAVDKTFIKRSFKRNPNLNLVIKIGGSSFIRLS